MYIYHMYICIGSRMRSRIRDRQARRFSSKAFKEHVQQL